MEDLILYAGLDGWTEYTANLLLISIAIECTFSHKHIISIEEINNQIYLDIKSMCR